MRFFVLPNFKYYLIAAILVAVFVILVLGGATAGRKKAQSAMVLSQAQGLIKALDFFYGDNDRFPTADEFANEQIMFNYLSRYPATADVQTSVCPQSFVYLRSSPQSFQLNFCLPRVTGAYQKGWNVWHKN